MEFASAPSCGGVDGGRAGLSAVNLRAESDSLGSSHSPQKRHLIASCRICSLQKGHSLNALSAIASILPRRGFLFIQPENDTSHRDYADCEPIHADPSGAIQMDAENRII